MKDLIIHDLHLGVQRSGGTTTVSQQELREYARDNHRNLLDLAQENEVDRLIYNGDITDQYDITLTEAIDVFADVRNFMECNPTVKVIWALGNHDLSKDSSKLGTVMFLGQLLRAFYPGRFFLVDQPQAFTGGVYIIPHLANQELFNAALAGVPEDTKFLLLHCNFDNQFAVHQDHSLNISREQAKEITRRGITIIIAHEHQGRDLMGGKVVIPGNQFPTSVSDCLAKDDAQKDGAKYCVLIDGGKVQRLRTWWRDVEPNGWYAEVDWKDLRDTTESGRGFIRVTGAASGAEAADVIKEISAFRQRSRSFVITNAVKIEKPEGMEDLPDTIEDIKQVNVMELLYEMVQPEQAAKIRELRGETR